MGETAKVFSHVLRSDWPLRSDRHVACSCDSLFGGFMFLCMTFEPSSTELEAALLGWSMLYSLGLFGL